MDNTPLVSILILTWNRREDLMRSIRSALRQDYPNCEIVVVDNASTDGTVEMIRQDFPEIRLICSHKNLGCPSGRNLGMANCLGEYIYSLDDDGWLKGDAVRIAVERAEMDRSLGVVMSVIHESENGCKIRVRPDCRQGVFRHSFIGCCSMLRRAAIEEVGFFPDDFFRQGEESDLAIRLLDAGWFCFVEPRSIMYHAPSAVGRDLKAFLYYSLRNTTKTGLRLWPFPYNVGRVLVNALHGLRILFIRGDLWTFVRLSANLIQDMLFLKGKRKPVGLHTMRLYRWLQKHPSPDRPEINPRTRA